MEAITGTTTIQPGSLDLREIAIVEASHDIAAAKEAAYSNSIFIDTQTLDTQAPEAVEVAAEKPSVAPETTVALQALSTPTPAAGALSLKGRTPIQGGRSRPEVGTYGEMMKRIPKEERAQIEGKMAGLENVEENLQTIKGCLETGKYHKFSDDAFYYALRGVQEGKLPASYAVRISDIETLRRQRIDFKVIDPAKDTPEMEELIFLASIEHLTKEQFEMFYEGIKNLPPADRYLIVFESFMDSFKAIKTISKVLVEEQKMNVLNEVLIDDRHFFTSEDGPVFAFEAWRPFGTEGARIFASLELFSLFLRIRFGEDAVTPNPVFGVSTPYQIETNGLTSTRDICCFYLVPEVWGENRLKTWDIADGFPCEENGFNYHDRYHTFVTSAVSKEIRELSVSIALKLKQYAPEQKQHLSKQDYAAMRFIRWQLIDMDYPYKYLQKYKELNKNEPSSNDPDSLYLLRSIFKLKFLSDDVFNGMVLPNFKAFETPQALEKTFNFIIDRLPQTEDFKAARIRYAKEIAMQYDAKRAALDRSIANLNCGNHQRETQLSELKSISIKIEQQRASTLRILNRG